MKAWLGCVSCMVLVLSGGVAPALQAADSSYDSGGLKPGRDVVRVRASAKVRDINRKTGHVILAHGPISSMGWPAMPAHELSVTRPELLDHIHVGQDVRFTINDAGLISEIKPE